MILVLYWFYTIKIIKISVESTLAFSYTLDTPYQQKVDRPTNSQACTSRKFLFDNETKDRATNTTIQVPDLIMWGW